MLAPPRYSAYTYKNKHAKYVRNETYYTLVCKTTLNKMNTLSMTRRQRKTHLFFSHHNMSTSTAHHAATQSPDFMVLM